MAEKKIHVPESFYSIFGIARMMGIPRSTIVHASEEGKSIENIEPLKPIAHLFTCIEEEGRKTWMIRKTYFDRWRKTGIVPKVSTGRPPKWTGDEKHINIPAPHFYGYFVSCINELNKKSTHKIAVRDVIYFAMEDYMKRHPSVFGVDCVWKQTKPNQLK